MKSFILAHKHTYLDSHRSCRVGTVTVDSGAGDSHGHQRKGSRPAAVQYPALANHCRGYSCLFVCIHFLFMFIYGYACLFVFIRGHAWLFMLNHVKSWLFMFNHVYLCLFVFIRVYSCLLMFIHVKSCLFILFMFIRV